MSTAPLSSRAELRCVVCGLVTESPAEDFRCGSCGNLLECTFPDWPASTEPATAAQLKQLWLSRRTSFDRLDQSGVWRFREMLPALPHPDRIITLREGNTPLWELPRCARASGMNDGQLFAKHQGMNPTGSFKDTGMTGAISVAAQGSEYTGRTTEVRWVACASTGNTSASMAAYAARGGMRSVVLIPEGKVSWGKLSQSLDYGAVTIQLRTDFDGCLRLLTQAVREYPIYLLNSVNPYRLEGQKTAAIELAEQLNWTPPDHLIVPGGNLGNSSALGKAFREMRQLGLISRLPKISVIQAAGANPLACAMRENNGSMLTPMTPDTLATAIRIGNPASWRKAVRVVHETGGVVEDVTESEIAIAKAEIGADGIGCEPASAVTLAGLKKLIASGFVQPSESVVLLLTGHLLKDPEYTIDFHRDALLPHASDGERAAMRRLERAPIQLDADLGILLRTLQEAES